MRVFLLAALASNIIWPINAFASDMPVKAPIPAPVYDWTGFYLGANAGGAVGTVTVTSVVPGALFPAGFVYPPDAPSPAFIGGGQIGANYQLRYLVVGFEGSADWTSVTNSHAVPSPLIANFLAQGVGTVDSLFTAGGRLGVAWGSLLIYGKGAGVLARIHGYTNTFSGSVLTSQSVSPEHSERGWLLGAGAEWMLDGKWSVKGEYNYISLGPYPFENITTFSAVPAQIGTVTPSIAKWNINTFTVGLNYHL